MPVQRRNQLICLALGIQLICASETLFAWGSVGHDLITRVAVRLLQEKAKGNRKCTAPFMDKEVMLGHLANIPDTYWRAADPKLTAIGNPTHFIDWEIVSKTPSLATISTSYEKNIAVAEKACQEGAKDKICPSKALGEKNLSQILGSAPWRVGQFWDLMKQAMEKLSSAKDPGEFELDGNEMLKNAGLMSHFIGDLTMPLHSSVDYDAIGVGQGGLHAYFETAMVEALPLGLAQDVFDAAKKLSPYRKKILSQIPKKGASPSAVEIALATSFASFQRIGELEALDRKHSVLPNQPDTQKNKLVPSKSVPRIAASEAAKFNRELIIDQLALAADTLSELWLLAWEQGKSPDLSNFHSYFFWFSPEFVPPSYIGGVPQ